MVKNELPMITRRKGANCAQKRGQETGSGNDFRFSARQMSGVVVQRPDGSPTFWRSHRRVSGPQDWGIKNRKSEIVP